MLTQLKSDTARVNGAKSQGPKTAEGRAKSSRNATKHGLSSRNPLVLECENEDDFQAVHEQQMEIHQPATPAEKDLVDQMVAARWRILRLQSIETDVLDTEMRRRQENQRERGRDDIIRLSNAYTTVADNSRAMALASRCESRFTRIYQSSYKILRELQTAQAKQSTQPAAPVPIARDAAEPAKTQPAQKIVDIKPRTAIVSNASDASKLVGQADSLPADADVKAGGAGDSPARNREGDASL
jgi:hypothetical protein